MLRTSTFAAIAVAASMGLFAADSAEARDKFGVHIGPYGSSFHYRTGDASFGIRTGYHGPSVYYHQGTPYSGHKSKYGSHYGHTTHHGHSSHYYGRPVYKPTHYRPHHRHYTYRPVVVKHYPRKTVVYRPHTTYVCPRTRTYHSGYGSYYR